MLWVEGFMSMTSRPGSEEISLHAYPLRQSLEDSQVAMQKVR